MKISMGHELAGMSLPLTVTEMVALQVTTFLAWQIGRRIESLRNEILRLSVGPSSVAAQPFQDAQAECYREIRRARHYNRPAAVLSISPTKESMDLSINRFIQEAQNSIIQQYITARTADLLRATLKETDVITMRNNHFLVLLPETTVDHLPIIVERLQNSAKGKLGLSLNVGISTFPDEAITFESLVETAEKRMGDVSITGTPGTVVPVTGSKS
jgi:GGDEF domain-containing protein